MKQKVLITDGEKELFNKKIQNLPIKEEYIIKRSIELFDDEDPCIIHQSYVIKDYVDQVLDLLKENSVIEMKNHIEVFNALDYKNIEELTIKLLG